MNKGAFKKTPCKFYSLLFSYYIGGKSTLLITCTTPLEA